MQHPKKPRWNKIMKIVVVLLVLVVLQTLPIFFPRPLFAETLQSGSIRVHHTKGDEKGAREVLDLLVQRGGDILAQLGADGEPEVEVHLYPTQWQLAIREAGFATLLVAPEWHIGDSHGGNIMMVSPYTPVRVHDHDSILAAVLHEWVHAVNHRQNPEMNYFWDNGLATWLAGQTADEGMLRDMPFPSIEDMHTENGLKFGQMGGYAFSYDYIRYLTERHGWPKVAAYARGEGDHETVFGLSEEELYTNWKEACGK